MRPTIVTFLPVASNPCALYVGAGGFGRPEPRMSARIPAERRSNSAPSRTTSCRASSPAPPTTRPRRAATASSTTTGVATPTGGTQPTPKPVAASTASGRDNFAVCAPMADANRAASTPSVARTTATTCPPASVSKHNDLIAVPVAAADGTCTAAAFLRHSSIRPPGSLGVRARQSGHGCCSPEVLASSSTAAHISQR